MPRVVLDTNVLISAALTSSGKSRKILRMAFRGTLAVFYTFDILSEYADVFARPKFKLISESGAGLLKDIATIGNIVVPEASTVALPDERDRPFYDAAICAKATLITGNLKHYPKEYFIVSPSEFLVSLGVD